MKNSLLILLLFFLAQMAAMAAALLGVNLERLMGGAGIDQNLLLLHPEAYGVAMFVANLVLVGLLRALKLIRPFASLRGRLRPVGDTGLALAGMLLLAFGTSFLVQPLALPDDGQIEMFDAMKDNAVCFLLLTVVGPLTEEFVFREGILRNFVAKGVAPLLSAFITGAVFAAVHGNAAQAVPALVLGFAFGVLYVKTGNVRLSGAAHILNNSLAVLLLYFPETEAWLADAPALSVGLGVLLSLLGTSMLVLWWRRTPTTFSLTDPLKNEDRKD